MSWLTGAKLDQLIRKHGGEYCNRIFIFSRDHLTTLYAAIQTSLLIIYNTERHNLPGQHWKSAYIDTSRRGKYLTHWPRRLVTK